LALFRLSQDLPVLAIQQFFDEFGASEFHRNRTDDRPERRAPTDTTITLNNAGLKTIEAHEHDRAVLR
jgi:hypothetical protein